MARYGDQQTPFKENMKPKPVILMQFQVAAEEVLLNL